MDSPGFFPSRLFDQNFGMCITPQDTILPSNNIFNPNYFRPWKWYMQNDSRDCGSTIENDKNKFQITLDVHHFRPNELNVKIINREIVIEGKHEERLDEHGVVSRQFLRRYPLPSEYEAEDVTSNLSSDGVLMIVAVKKVKKTNEIAVPIKLCDAFSNSKEIKSETLETAKSEMSTSKKESKCEPSTKLAVGSTSSCNKSQLMLKDEQSCLLNPQYYKDTTSASVQKVESKNEKDKLLESSLAKAEESFSATALSTHEMIKMSKDKIDKSEASDIASNFISQSGNMATIDESFIKASDLKAKSSFEISEEMLKTSEVLGTTTIGSATEKASYSSSSMSSETMTSKETSSFMSAIMSSSLKETSEKTSELCDTISAALKEAAENL